MGKSYNLLDLINKEWVQRTIISWLCLFSVTACDRKSGTHGETIGTTNKIQIPVVFHVVYNGNNPESNITDQKIQSQIDVLNETFQARNSDLTKVPAPYRDLIADVGLHFYLAKFDPLGRPSIGVERKEEDLIAKKNTSSERNTPLTSMKKASWGGLDTWASARYLNVWVVDLSDEEGEPFVLGKATLPGEDPTFDGLILDYRVVGKLAPLIHSFELGRTATHEVGHWLGLFHLSDQNDRCISWDCVEDTPQIMGFNFMESLTDAEALMFTNEQKALMLKQFTPGGSRSSFVQAL